MKQETPSILVLLFTCFFAFSSINAQTLTGVTAWQSISGSDKINIDTQTGRINYIHFAQGHEPSATRFLDYLKRQLNYEEGYSFSLLKTTRDPLDFAHHRYQIHYQNTPIEGAITLVHTRQGKVESVNGYFPQVEGMEMFPILTAEFALQTAKSHFDAQEYHPQSATEGSGELVIFHEEQNKQHSRNEPNLAYKFDLYATKPYKRAFIFVDAQTGEIVYENNRIHTADSLGVGELHYSGTRDLTTDSFEDGFRLRESGRNIETLNLNNGINNLVATDFVDNDNNWTQAEHDNANNDDVALDAHWGAEMTHDYYLQKLGRNSIDGNGGMFTSYVHLSMDVANAFWNGEFVFYGDGDGTTGPLAALDICAHEITHGLTSFTADLAYQNEPGSLNESFSDIFAVAIEFFARPDNANWTIGEDLSSTGTFARSLSDPNSLGDPDTYLGNGWYIGEADNGGIHTNSSVQNYWFYLLSEGGTGTNDLGDTYTVSGIGMDAAIQIAYHNLNTYLSQFSDYEEARFFAIQSAIDLFGVCSPEVIACTNAWYAVGLGNAYSSQPTVDFTTLPKHYCQAPQSVQFINNSQAAASQVWDFGDGNTSTAPYPTHTYTNAGTYTVSLTNMACDGTVQSSQQTDFIVIENSAACVNTMPATDSQTIFNCTGKLLDSGSAFDYPDETNVVTTIQAGFGEQVTLDFLQFAFEDNFDYLVIYDGGDTTATLIGAYTGFTLPNGGQITSTGNSITLRQITNMQVHHAGFELNWSCAATPNDEVNCIENVSEITLGSAANIYSIINNHPNQLAVDNDLNTLVFLHRNNPTLFGGHSGEIRYDISTNNGANWMLNQGILNTGSTQGVNEGRYPQGAIYNPTQSSNLADAYLTYYAPNTNGSGWNGHVSGRANLATGSTTAHYDQAVQSDFEIPGGLCESTTGVFWTIDQVEGTSDIRILRGEYQTDNSIDWATQETVSFNTHIPNTEVRDWNMAFDPSGMNGWVVVLTHLANTLDELQNYPVVVQTTDGGNTWSQPQQIDLHQMASITQHLPYFAYPTCGYEIDLAVDANGKPHLLVDIGSGNGRNYILDISSTHGMYHLFLDENDTWQAERLASLQTFSATIGLGDPILTHFTRPQLSRSKDGTTLVFAWSDSESATTNGFNNHPDLFVKGYNINSKVYTPILNATTCLPVDMPILFATVSPILLENASAYTLPVIFGQLSLTGSHIDPASFHYLKDVTLDKCSLIPNLTFLPQINSNDTEICAGESTDLSLEDTYATYQWSNGANTPSISVDAADTYEVTVSNAEGCIGQANLTIDLVPFVVEAGNDTTICVNENITLNTPTVGNSYLWADDSGSIISGSASVFLSPLNTATYTLSVTNAEGCMDTDSIQVTVQPCDLDSLVQLKVFLQGAYNSVTGLINTQLADNDLLPLNQPFDTSPWNYTNTLIINDLPNDVVDWILVELRTPTNYDLVEQQVGFLRNDGLVISPNGQQEGLVFENTTSGVPYHIVVRTRNHLDVLGSSPIMLPMTTPYDFTQTNQVVNGASQLILVNGTTNTWGLRSGDIDGNGVITISDYNLYITQASQIGQYATPDLNLDGNITITDFNLYQINASIIGVDAIRF